MKQVIIDAEAEHELAESVTFYEGRQRGLGLAFERAARETVSVIQAEPDQSLLLRNGTRRRRVRKFPFVIYYADLPETIWILAFAHTSRKPGCWKRRF